MQSSQQCRWAFSEIQDPRAFAWWPRFDLGGQDSGSKAASGWKILTNSSAFLHIFPLGLFTVSLLFCPYSLKPYDFKFSLRFEVTQLAQQSRGGSKLKGNSSCATPTQFIETDRDQWGNPPPKKNPDLNFPASSNVRFYFMQFLHCKSKTQLESAIILLKCIWKCFLSEGNNLI